MQETDIAVVGAGPAGSWAAYNLARSGARVTIYDPTHPREKPCGGGITARALALVGGAIGDLDVPAASIRRARFVDSGTGRSAVVPLDPFDTLGADDGPSRRAGAAALVVASRAAFDEALLAAARRAGATLAAARITNIAVDPGCVRIESTSGLVRAGFLIGADGANSLVRRRLARPFRRDELSIATGYFAHGITSNEIVIELTDDPPGYIWSFPRPTHLAIGICAQADAGLTAAALRARTAAWIRHTRIAEGARLEPYSWPVPSLGVGSLRRVELAGTRWCVVGDAAGLVDPITREGISFALASGAWAAEAAMAGDASQYAARVRADLLPELARAARLKAGFFRLASTGLLIRALGCSSAVRDVLADLVAGRQGYAGLRWQLLKTLEWRLAWEALVSGKRIRRGPGHEHRV
jgi:flavin-dependent dehydrogenase